MIAGLNLDKLNNIIKKNKAMTIKNKILKNITINKTGLTYKTLDLDKKYI